MEKMTIEQAILQYNSDLTRAILQDPDFVQATASGNFAEFINTAGSYELTRTAEAVTFTKYGTSYTDALDFGTPPSNQQGLEKQLYDWLKFKKYGLEWRTEKQRKGLAGFLASRIQRFGSYKHRNKEAQTNIIAGALDRTQAGLFEKLNEAHRTEVDATITRSLTDKI